GGTVSGIDEIISQMFSDGSEFGVALEVAVPFCGQYLFKQTQMPGNAMRDRYVGRCGKNDPPPVILFAAQIGQERLVIGQVLGGDVDFVGDSALEACAPFR